MNKENALDKQRIAKSFSRGRQTYDDNAIIQRRVSAKLMEMLSGCEGVRSQRVLEIGCCTGTLTELLLTKYSVETLYLNDLVTSFYEDVRARVANNSRRPLQNTELSPMFGDIETIALPAALDLVISSATFQWLTDLEGLFARIASSLNSGGFLAFSIFGPGTLREFKELTGIGLQYSGVGSILDLLDHHFYIQEQETVKEQLFFASPREVLRHLQATGVGGVGAYTWTPNKLRQFENAYYERYGSASGVPLTYMSSHVIASKK